MKFLPLAIAGLLAIETTVPLAAVAQNAPSWAQNLGSPDATHISRVVTDASNSTFVVGSLTGAATLGPFALPVGGAQLHNGFVARLDAQGAVQWVRYLAAAGSGLATDVTGLALDAAGNAVICGSYHNGSLTLGAATLPVNTTNPAWDNGLVAKLDPTGNVLWAQAIIAPNTSLRATAAALDGAGTAYVATSSQAMSAFASGIGLRTFSSAGVLATSYDYPGVSGVVATSPLGVFGAILDLKVNPTTGQLGAVGDFQGTLMLRAGGTLPALALTSPAEPQRGAFVASLAPTGEPQWAQELTSTGMSLNGRTGSFLNRMNALAPVGAGFVVAGGYIGAGNLAGTALPGSNTSDNFTAVLARFDAQGAVQWTRSISGDGVSGSGALARAVATDAAGQVHVTGLFGGHLAANGGGLTSAGGADLFVLRYSDQGQLLGAQRDGSYGNETPFALAIDPQGQPRIAGDFVGTISLGGTVLASGPRPNSFVTRLAATPLATRNSSAAAVALQVFPNPSAGVAALQISLLPGAAPATLRLLNSLGQQVHGRVVPARVARASVPTAGLAAGHYVLQVVSAEGVATRGVVVE